MNSRADIARRYGVSRARVTQVMSLLHLSRPVQDRLLGLPEEEQARYPERGLRKVVGLKREAAQAQAFERLSQAVAGSDAG